MTKLFLLLVFWTIAINFSTFCQVQICGKILHSKNDIPVPYANIGILDSEVGTISNEDGSFCIRIPASYQEKEITFSSVGYSQKTIQVSSLVDEQNITILLDEKAVQLNTVYVLGKKTKKQTVTLGNGRSLLLSGQLYSDTLSAGSAMALLIQKPDISDLNFINEVSLHIARNKFPSFKVRLRFLKVDSANNNKPGADLINHQIIEISDMKQGWLEFDLFNSIEIKEKSFYVMFEWIIDRKDRQYIEDKFKEFVTQYPNRVTYDTVIVKGEKLSIPKVGKVLAGTFFGTTQTKSDLENNHCFYRTNSFGEWKRSTGVLSAKIKMANYPSKVSNVNDIMPCKEQNVACAIDLWAKGFQKQQSMPGLQVAIKKNGKSIFSRGYGYTDLAQKKAVNNQSQFRIASVSKTMTATALMKLLKENKLNPDTLVQAYVPSFPTKKYPVTIRQVAGHLGGLRDYYEKSWDEIFIQDHYMNSTQAVELFQDDSLLVKPGAGFLYSSYGYILLGAAIEGITGLSYLKYMSKTIWQPLGLTNTYGEVKDSVMVKKSKFYYLNGEEAKPYNLSYSYPSGGLLSTAEDLAKFGSALLPDHNFLNDQLRKELFTSQVTTNNHATGYGLGWYVSKDRNGHPVWYHAGELPSSGALLLIYPQDNIVISILSNAPIIMDSGDGLWHEAQDLAEIIYNN